MYSRRCRGSGLLLTVSTAITASVSAKTGPHGEFVFAPLSPGDYAIYVRDNSDSKQSWLQPRFKPTLVSLEPSQSSKSLDIRALYDASTSVDISGHISIDKQLLNQVIQLRSLMRSGWAQLDGSDNRLESRTMLEEDTPEAMLKHFRRRYLGTINGTKVATKGDINPDGHFTIHVPRGMDRAVVLLASAGV